MKEAKIHGWKEGRVDVALTSMRTTQDVYWSPRWEGSGGARGGCNSYVLARKDDGVGLYSVNGIGEVRWEVFQQYLPMWVEQELTSWRRDSWRHSDAAEQLAAARHFGLVDRSVLSKVLHRDGCEPAVFCDCVSLREHLCEALAHFGALRAGTEPVTPWLTKEQAIEQASARFAKLLAEHGLPEIDEESAK
jgi:hypothetical protein